MFHIYYLYLCIFIVYFILDSTYCFLYIYLLPELYIIIVIYLVLEIYIYIYIHYLICFDRSYTS